MVTNTKEEQIDVISVRRNPYLEEYGAARRRQEQHMSRNQGKLSGGSAFRNRNMPVNGRTGPQRSRFAGRMPVKRRRRRLLTRILVSLSILAFMVLGVSLLVKYSHVAAAMGGGQKTAVGSGAGAGNTDDAGGKSAPQDPPADVFVQGIPAEAFALHPEWEEDFLTPNEYSRPGDELKEVKNIFVHYTANPGTSAAQNRSYFERQKDEHLASVSSHFIIGYDGEIIQCVPLTEIAYAVQTRNFDSVSIECCYKAKDGSFTEKTYQSLLELLAWLTDVYDLDTEDILRHYDCGGKKCPLYYTEHEDEWTKLKEDVKEMRQNTGVKL